MTFVLRESPRVRDAKLSSTLAASYVAPLPPNLRDPSNSLVGISRESRRRISKASSLPLSHLSSLSNEFDKSIEDDGPGLRRILLPAPPSRRSISRAAAPVQRRRQRLAAVAASASAAAAQTLQRQQEQREELLQRESAGASQLRVRGGQTLAAWHPPYFCTDAGGTAEAPLVPRKTATVTSPHAAAREGRATERAGSAQPSTPAAPPKLRWRLRRCKAGAGGGVARAGAAVSSPLLDRTTSPLDVLRHLGSATFNDAPLHTFLSGLDLRLPSSRSAAAAATDPFNAANANGTDPHAREATAEQMRWRTLRDGDGRRRRSGRPRVDTAVIHLGDVEARSFRVEAAAGESSLLQGLIDAYPACPWDGAEFLLLPLEDERRLALDAMAPRLTGASALPYDESVSLTGEHGASLSYGQESPHGLELPGAAMNFLRSANASFAAANVSSSGGGDDEARATGWATASPAEAAVAGAPPLLDGPVFGHALEGQDAEGHTLASVVPRWKRFSTVAALYLALGDAGGCDTAFFPYAAVQLCTWGDLVAQPHTRMEMMASCSAAALHTLHAARGSKRAERVPVAVLFPTTRKGVMRRPLSLTTQPFTDAEIFQLFYLQLILRAYFDVRLPTLAFRLRGQSEWQLRSDWIAVRSSGRQGVAFEHPLDANSWLRFPPHTRLLTLLSLDEAVVPLYATAAELQESAVLPLFGGGDSLPCIGRVGRAMTRWAATVEVSSPATAMAALARLFDAAGGSYCTTRAELWDAVSTPGRSHAGPSRPPLLFRCGATSVGAALTRCGGILSRFFVPPDKRGVQQGAVEHAATFRDMGTSYESSGMQSNATRQTQLPFLPPDCSRAPTALASVAVTPHQQALQAVVLKLEDSQAVPESVTDAFASTFMAGPNLNQSRTNAFASTFDVVHLSAVPSPATEDAAVAAVGSSAHGFFVPPVEASPSPSRERLRVVDVASSPLQSLPTVALKGVESLESRSETRSETTTSSSRSALLQNASFVGMASPFTKQESLVTRWRYYVESGNCEIFDGTTAGIQVLDFVGRGGSGMVYRGTYGSRRLPVAVKVLIIPDGMTHEAYVRESLTDVAFYVLADQLSDYGITYNGRAHDFIVSNVAPRGLPDADAAEARRGGDPATTRLCYFITDLMDGTVGRFLDANDADFDPVYDQLLNSPLRECELFQFLFNQLVFKTLFDWRVLDLMLNNQLRGDNVGYRYISLPPEQAAHLREHPDEAASLAQARQYYAGILYAFQFAAEEEVRYLRFPANNAAGSGDDTPLRLICMIDVGQGTQPNIAELVRNGYVGESVVASCVEDDGFGRFWPLDELYCRYVDVKGSLCDEVVAWGSKVRVATQEAAFDALQELVRLYYPTFGVATPSEEELSTYLCLSWTPANVASLKEAYVYRA